MVKNYITMGMPARVNIVDKKANEQDVEEIFSYFDHIDSIFSTYKPTSEISRINNGKLDIQHARKEVREVLALCEETRKKTHGYFDITRQGKIDPSGFVKGYAIHEAGKRLRQKGYKNFSVEIAGDVEVAGFSKGGSQGKFSSKGWRIGIQNPFNTKEIIKVLSVTDKGIATSGNYMRGNHIYDPMTKQFVNEIMSMTVIAENVQEADILATTTFAMGEKGIEFLEKMKNIEGYMIRKDQQAVYTSGFERYTI